ncbi:anti-sigma factor [Bacillus amyloliquefaciens]
MELVRIFKEHNVFGWISVGTAILSLLLLNVAIISNVTFYSYQMLPFAMAAVPFGIIELFIKKGRTGLLGVILNLFVIVCVYTIVAVDTNLQFGF